LASRIRRSAVAPLGSIALAATEWITLVTLTLPFDPVTHPIEPIVATIHSDQASDADDYQHAGDDERDHRSTTCSSTTRFIHAQEVTRRR